MQITPFLVQVKSRLYGRKPSIRRILDDPSLVMYFDSALYRPLIEGDIDGDSMATFPAGWLLGPAPSSEMPFAEDGVLGGRLIFAPADLEEETPDRLLALDGSEDGQLEAINDIFQEGSWTVFVALSEVETTVEASSILDFQNGGTGAFRIDLTESRQLSVSYTLGEEGDPVVLSPSVGAGADCWVCVRKDGLDYEVIVNGDTIHSYQFDEPSNLNVSQGLLGGRFSSSTVDSVIDAKLSMFALYSDAISDEQLSRLTSRMTLLNKSVEYELPSVLPVFVNEPYLSGGALPGAPVVGNVLTIVGEVLTGYPTPDITIEWRADGITVAEAATYTVLVGDVGKVITAAVSASNRAGTVDVETLPTEAVVAA